jgi:hypothetical protein
LTAQHRPQTTQSSIELFKILIAQNDYPKEASWAGDRIIERRRVNTLLRPICASKCNGSGLQMKRNGGTIDVFGAAFPQGKRIE